MRAIDLYRTVLPHLVCPDCRTTVAHAADGVQCLNCRRSFPVTHTGVLTMLPTHSRPEPAIYDDSDFKKYRALYDGDAEQVYYSNQNSLFHWIHHSAHKRTDEYWRDGAVSGWVADIGCGTGDHFGYFRDLSRVVGIDMSLGSLNAVRRRHPDAILIQADINALPFGDSTFDAVFSIYNLEHLYYLRDSLEEIARILAQHGRLFVGLPTEGGVAWGLGRKLSTERMYSKKYGIDY